MPRGNTGRGIGLIALALALMGATLLLPACTQAKGSLRERIKERIAQKRNAGSEPAGQSGENDGLSDGSSGLRDDGNSKVAVKRNVTYEKVDGHALHLDLYLPQGQGEHPVLLYIHGGAWTGGSKDFGAPMLKRAAERGYLGASVEYRLAGIAPWPAQIEDCKAAADWLVAHAADYGGDASKFAVTGGSAGGHLALLLACGWGSATLPPVDGQPQEEPWPGRPVQACCSWYGPTDMRQIADLPKISKNIQEFLGKTQAEREVNSPLASPILFVDSHDPPVLFIHGTADPLVPIRQAQRMDEKLKAAGVETRFIRVEGGSHGVKLASPKEMAKLNDQMLDWFEDILGKH